MINLSVKWSTCLITCLQNFRNTSKEYERVAPSDENPLSVIYFFNPKTRCAVVIFKVHNNSTPKMEILTIDSKYEYWLKILHSNASLNRIDWKNDLQKWHVVEEGDNVRDLTEKVKGYLHH